MIEIDVSPTLQHMSGYNGFCYRHNGCRTCRHDGYHYRRSGCLYRRSGCNKYRQSGYFELSPDYPNVITDAATPLQRMQHCRHNGCIAKLKKRKYAFIHRAHRIQPGNANPFLIFSNYRGTSTDIDQETDRARKTFEQHSSRCKGFRHFDVNRCKNIAKFTFECKRIQNFRFVYIAMLRATTRSPRNRMPNDAASPPIFSVAAYARSRGVKGPPLPTQFGFAKLYRG